MSREKSLITRYAEACGIEFEGWISLKEAQDEYEASAKERSELAIKILEENRIYVPQDAR